MMGVAEWVALPFLLLIGCINVANSISGEPRLWPPEEVTQDD